MVGSYHPQMVGLWHLVSHIIFGIAAGLFLQVFPALRRSIHELRRGAALQLVTFEISQLWGFTQNP